MKEHPIIMSGNHPKLILDGLKTQTRRVITWKPLEEGLNLSFTGLSVGDYCTGNPLSGKVLYSRRGDGVWEQRTNRMFCPYGQVGDRLWVKETWAGGQFSVSEADILYKADGQVITHQIPEDKLSTNFDLERWWPSIFMPRWASRITLEITGVRVERVQEIDVEDIKKEGIEYPFNSDNFPYLNPQEIWNKQMLDGFGELWDSLNAKRGYGWGTNCWVWVIIFRRVEV